MEIKYTSLHQIDTVKGVIPKVTQATNQDYIDFVENLFSEIKKSSRSRNYLFKSDTTEVRTIIGTLLEKSDRDALLRCAERLLESEQLAQLKVDRLGREIKKGSLFQACIFDPNPSLIICKVEHNEFLNEEDFLKKSGLPIENKIYKAALFEFDSKLESTRILVYDTNSTISKYWWSDFLELTEKFNDQHNTKTSLDLFDRKIFSKIKQISPVDHTILRNGAITYFRTQEEFETEKFIDTIFNGYHPVEDRITQEKIDEYKFAIRSLPESGKFDPRFKISKPDINKRISTKLKISEGLELSFSNDVKNFVGLLEPYIDTENNKWLMIRSDDGYELAENIKKQ